MMENNEKIWWVYSTFPTRDEALSLARSLLDQKLVACANITPGITSLYHWEGKLEQQEETALVLKTSEFRAAEAMDWLRRHHPYATPCILGWPVEHGTPEFFRWVKTQTL